MGGTKAGSDDASELDSLEEISEEASLEAAADETSEADSLEASDEDSEEETSEESVSADSSDEERVRRDKEEEEPPQEKRTRLDKISRRPFFMTGLFYEVWFSVVRKKEMFLRMKSLEDLTPLYGGFVSAGTYALQSIEIK